MDQRDFAVSFALSFAVLESETQSEDTVLFNLFCATVESLEFVVLSVLESATKASAFDGVILP